MTDVWYRCTGCGERYTWGAVRPDYVDCFWCLKLPMEQCDPPPDAPKVCCWCGSADRGEGGLCFGCQYEVAGG